MLALRRSSVLFAFGALPILLTAAVLLVGAGTDNFAFDVHHAYWQAARDILHATSPYPRPDDATVAAGTAFVYPAPAALLLTPLGLMPRHLADWTFTIAMLLAAPATLRVLRVTDWRVYGVALLWSPVVTGWYAANITMLLALGIAVAWRLRARPAAVGFTIGLLVAVKLFLWPLALWLLLTRRYRALGWGVATAAALNAAGWTVIGWDTVPGYLDLLHALSTAMAPHAYSLATLGAVGLAAEVALAGMLVVVGRRGDAQALSASVAVALLLSPLVWGHYFALLLVPVALAHPRLHWVWLLPVLTWASYPGLDPAGWQLAVMLTLAAVTVGACLRTRAGTTKPRAMAGLRELPARL